MYVKQWNDQLMEMSISLRLQKKREKPLASQSFLPPRACTICRLLVLWWSSNPEMTEEYDTAMCYIKKSTKITCSSILVVVAALSRDICLLSSSRSPSVRLLSHETPTVSEQHSISMIITFIHVKTHWREINHRPFAFARRRIEMWGISKKIKIGHIKCSTEIVL